MPVELHERLECVELTPLFGQPEAGSHAIVQVEAAAVVAEIEQLRARDGEHGALRLPGALLRVRVHLPIAIGIDLSGGRGLSLRRLRPERALRVEQWQLAHILVRGDHQPYVANRRVELQAPLEVLVHVNSCLTEQTYVVRVQYTDYTLYSSE